MKKKENSIMNLQDCHLVHLFLAAAIYPLAWVQQLGNKPVSWIRVRDGHILTVDRAVFIADQRFVVLNQPNKFWTLQIKYVQARDAGAYECQVSTEPKVSAKVYLDVVVPRTEISGEPDRYVKAGSIVVLRCLSGVL
ncbi:lachesin-like isoform X2 [Eupeodes corollae]|uniref:lachesin-like isoform X2 n=1 Tax=Eupeodes corollae TaxID=290404 RepID=UPI0024937D26|nr:lachesin-like isoform X2 [Eupeodes corollae]